MASWKTFGDSGTVGWNPFFDELSFNEAVELRHVMGIKVPVSRRDESNIVLQWPEFNPFVHIKAPPGTRAL